MISAFAPLLRGSFCMTPGRTVAICGRKSGMAMVAMVLPPNAGRVMSSCLCRVSLPGMGVMGKSPMSSLVQSAVRPVCTVAATQGARSRPMAVAPKSTTSGLNSRMIAEMAWVYGSVMYSFRNG